MGDDGNVAEFHGMLLFGPGNAQAAISPDNGICLPLTLKTRDVRGGASPQKRSPANGPGTSDAFAAQYIQETAKNNGCPRPILAPISQLEHDPERWGPVLPSNKPEAFARRSCSIRNPERGGDGT
jgi:hypothetical protein